MAKKIQKQIAHLLIWALAITSLQAVSFVVVPPKVAKAANPQIRQEINLIDAVHTSTSSAISLLDTTKYGGTVTYYFETVAKVTSGTAKLSLTRVEGTTATTVDVTISETATSYTLQRSSFTPPSGQTEYALGVSGGSSPSVIAARIVIIQLSSDSNLPSATETQIEIGNQETGKTNTATSTLSSPKYWKYTSANWNGNPTVYAEVVWKKTDTEVTSTSTTYTTDGSITIPPSATNIVIETWGGGGGASP